MSTSTLYFRAGMTRFGIRILFEKKKNWKKLGFLIRPIGNIFRGVEGWFEGGWGGWMEGIERGWKERKGRKTTKKRGGREREIRPRKKSEETTKVTTISSLFRKGQSTFYNNNIPERDLHRSFSPPLFSFFLSFFFLLFSFLLFPFEAIYIY